MKRRITQAISCGPKGNLLCYDDGTIQFVAKLAPTVGMFDWANPQGDPVEYETRPHPVEAIQFISDPKTGETNLRQVLTFLGADRERSYVYDIQTAYSKEAFPREVSFVPSYGAKRLKVWHEQWFVWNADRHEWTTCSSVAFEHDYRQKKNKKRG